MRTRDDCDHRPRDDGTTYLRVSRKAATVAAIGRASRAAHSGTQGVEGTGVDGRTPELRPRLLQLPRDGR